MPLEQVLVEIVTRGIDHVIWVRTDQSGEGSSALLSSIQAKLESCGVERLVKNVSVLDRKPETVRRSQDVDFDLPQEWDQLVAEILQMAVPVKKQSPKLVLTSSKT